MFRPIPVHSSAGASSNQYEDLASPRSPLVSGGIPIVGRTIDEIMNTAESSFIEYGLYIHLVYEASTLLGYGLETAEEVIKLPWVSAARAKRGRTPFQVEKRHSDVLRLCAHSHSLPIRILAGSVHDLVAARSSEATSFSFVSNMFLDLSTMFEGGACLSFQTFKASSINTSDFATIMRHKVSECLDLSLSTTCLLLSPVVPSIFIQSLRTSQDMVDWGKSYEGQRKSSIQSNPSDNWVPLKKF